MKIGDTIELLEMPNDPNPIPVGTNGVVRGMKHIDTSGPKGSFYQVDVDWENDRKLMLVIPPDKVRILK